MKRGVDGDVIGVEPVAPLRLKVSFADGTVGVVQFETSHLTGVFEALKDPALFARAFVDEGAVAWPGNAVAWPGNIDIAPDAMHAAIKATGEWVLR